MVQAEINPSALLGPNDWSVVAKAEELGSSEEEEEEEGEQRKEEKKRSFLILMANEFSIRTKWQGLASRLFTQHYPRQEVPTTLLLHLQLIPASSMIRLHSCGTQINKHRRPCIKHTPLQSTSNNQFLIHKQYEVCSL